MNIINSKSNNIFQNKLFLTGMLFIIFLLLRMPPYFIWPDTDTGRFAADAMMLNDGAMLYSGVWGHKTPGMYVIFALWFKLFGTNVYLFEFLGTIVFSFLCISQYLLCKELFNSKISYVAVLLFIFAGSYQGYSLDGLDSEYFFMLPVLLGNLFLIKGLKRDRTLYVFICGLLLGCAFFVKQLAIWNMMAVGIYLCYLLIKEGRSVFHIKNILLFCFGVILIQLIWMSYFYFNGSFKDMIDCVFISNIAYTKDHHEGISLLIYSIRCIGKAIIGIFIIWVTALFQFVLFFKYLNKKNNIFLIVTIVFSVTAVSTSLRFYGHYFLQIIPWICILSSVFFVSFYQKYSKKIKVNLFTLIVLLISLIFYFFIQFNYFQKYGYDNPFSKLKTVASYINKNTKIEDTIYVWGSPETIYFLTNKVCPVKYLFIPPESMLGFDPKDDILKTLILTKPKYIIKTANYSQFNGLSLFIKKNYLLDKKIKVEKFGKSTISEYVSIYRNRD